MKTILGKFINGDAAKLKFKTLKDKMRGIVNEDMTRRSGSATGSPDGWPFYDEMKFITHLVIKEQ